MGQNVAKSRHRLLTFVAMALFGTAAAAAPMSVRELGQQQLRVATVGYRIGAANARTCARPQMLSGLVVHDLSAYRPEARAAVSAAFSLHAGIGVLGVVPGSTAEQAGVRVDDEILSVNGASVANPSLAYNGPQSSRRMTAFPVWLSTALAQGSADLLIHRAGAPLVHLTLRGQPACGGAATLANTSDLNAWSDGKSVFVSSAMLQLMRGDDELSFVVAHEMAHNILGHSSGGDARGLLGAFGLGALKVRREETVADATAIPLMSAGGFRAEAAVILMQRMRRALWWNVSLDHPGFGERIRTVAEAIARLPVRPA